MPCDLGKDAGNVVKQKYHSWNEGKEISIGATEVIADVRRSRPFTIKLKYNVLLLVTTTSPILKRRKAMPMYTS